jgi:hypothetical protein
MSEWPHVVATGSGKAFRSALIPVSNPSSQHFAATASDPAIKAFTAAQAIKSLQIKRNIGISLAMRPVFQRRLPTR